VARTDDDTWDLASSVGATATLVAAARAVASRAEHPLISDPFAEPLVRAVGVDLLSRLAAGDVTPDELGEGAGTGMQRMADSMAVRTMFFDDFFLDATEAGLTQAVILAAGLDSRAYRLPWPERTTVFEVDQPDVIAFKTGTLAELGAEPTAQRRTVAVDLRDDWPAALAAEGFDPATRACSAIFHRTPRTACSTPSPRCRHRAAGSPPRVRPPRTQATRTSCGSACSRSPTTGASTGSI
jgi:O-methyltransferase involved in polyketide biosynthesis